MNFFREHLKKILFIFTTFMLIILIGLSSIGRFKNINFGVLGSTVSKFQKITHNFGSTLTNSFFSVQEIVRMREENILLTETVHTLEDRVRTLENIVNKSEALETEYNMKLKLVYDYEQSQIIALDDSNWFSRFTIDKGKKHGIKVNDIVIQAVETDENVVQIGLVGIVTETNYDWSKVITILDETCKISFRDINNEESGIMQGSIDGTVSGIFFNSKAVASVGEFLTTSGIGEIYIPDIHIGKISEVVKTTEASMQKIIIEPAVEFTKLNKVFVLKVDR